MQDKNNILYIDKDEHWSKTFRSLLYKRYQIYTADTIIAGKEILENNDIDLVMIEEEMPQISGLAFLKSITHDYPVQMRILTGSNNNSDTIISAFNSDSVRRYFQKPWNEKELSETIDDLIKITIKQQEQKHLVDVLQLREINFLREISLQLSERKPLPQLLDDIMESSKVLMQAEASSLLLYDTKDNKLHFKVASGEKGQLIKKYSVEMGIGIAGWVAEHREPILIEDCYSDPRFDPTYDKKTKFRTKSMICAPLIKKDQLLGVIEVINKRGGGVFTKDDLTIFETLASQCAIAIENDKLIESQIESEAVERELETAREIQQALLPSSLPVYDDIEVKVMLIPAKRVSGDYYNVLKINDNQSLFFLADVTGKSISAGLIVSTIYSCLQTYLDLHQENFDLMTLVTSLNRVLIESTTSGKFATCWFGLYNHDSKKLLSVNGGHNPPCILKKFNKKPIELEIGGIVLGSFDWPYKSEEVQMETGDILIFFTDGVTEAWNINEDEYGLQRLIKTVAKHLSKSATDILSEIERNVQIHVGNARQSDDITCGILKIL